MNAIRGRVRHGHVELDTELPDGTDVVVLVPGDGQPFDLDEESLAELEARIAESNAGGLVTAAEVAARLRAPR